MRVKYVGPFDAVEGPGFAAEAGEVIEVGDDLGASLLQQADNWQKADTKAEAAPKTEKKEG